MDPPLEPPATTIISRHPLRPRFWEKIPKNSKNGVKSLEVKHLRDQNPENSQNAQKNVQNARILIIGGPKTGKTTLGRRFKAKSTDELIPGTSFEAQVTAAAGWMDQPGPWAIEGVTGVRALREWIREHPGQKPPVDRVIYLKTPYVPLSRRQGAMAKGIETVWREIEGEVKRLGVEVSE